MKAVIEPPRMPDQAQDRMFVDPKVRDLDCTESNANLDDSLLKILHSQ